MNKLPEITSFDEFLDHRGDYEGFSMTVELPLPDGDTVEVLVEDDGRSGDYMVSTISAYYSNTKVKALWDYFIEESGVSKWEYVELLIENYEG